MLRSLRYYRRNDRAHSFTVDQTFNNMFSKKYIKKKKRRRKGKKRQKKKRRQIIKFTYQLFLHGKVTLRPEAFPVCSHTLQCTYVNWPSAQSALPQLVTLYHRKLTGDVFCHTNGRGARTGSDVTNYGRDKSGVKAS